MTAKIIPFPSRKTRPHADSTRHFEIDLETLLKTIDCSPFAPSSPTQRPRQNIACKPPMTRHQQSKVHPKPDKAARRRFYEEDGYVDIDKATDRRKRFLTKHFIDRSIDECVAQALRELDGFRESSDGTHNCTDVRRWIRCGTFPDHADTRIGPAIHGMRQIGFEILARELEAYYETWKPRWDTLRGSMPEQKPASKGARQLLYREAIKRAESLIHQLEVKLVQVANRIPPVDT